MKTFLCCICVCWACFSPAQQHPQYTQYLMNNYVLNPAASGTESYFEAKMGARTQWTGLEASPNTFLFSVHGPIHYPDERYDTYHHKPHHGIGGYAFADFTGPYQWSGAYLSYSYHIKLDKQYTLSLGISGGFKNLKIKGDWFNFIHTPDDPAVPEGDRSLVVPDANLGLWLYSDNLFAGVSSQQVLQNPLSLPQPDGAQGEGKLSTHYFATGGYKIPLNSNMFLVPSVMVQAVYPAPVQFDLNAKYIYISRKPKFAQKTGLANYSLWLGAMYRNLDALAGIAGATVNNRLDVWYSFDLTYSRLLPHQYGTHEIFIGYRFLDESLHLVCPSSIWR